MTIKYRTFLFIYIIITIYINITKIKMQETNIGMGRKSVI